MEHAERSPDRSGPLLAILTVALLVAMVSAIGWYQAATREVRVEALSAAQRQALVEELIDRSPGVHEAAWYAPEIGYTLRRSASLEAWGDRFETNELGYRTHAAAKPPGTFRVLFVGDSWTYGMGVRERESFPSVFQALAREHSGTEEVQAWTLALPGYETGSQAAALEFFLGRLAPDAVVWAPSANDLHASRQVLPNGSLAWVPRTEPDELGRRFVTHYRTGRFTNSYEFLRRWQTAFARLRAAEQRLQAQGVPTAFVYVARWPEPDVVHGLVARAGLESPYSIVPVELTLGQWLNPDPTAHGNPAAQRRYAQLAYRTLAPLLGWAPLPDRVLHEEIATVPVFSSPPAGHSWRQDVAPLLDRWTQEAVPEDYAAEPGREAQWAGPGQPATGHVGSGTSILVRRPDDVGALEITVARVEGLRDFYPLVVEIAIPSAAGGTRGELTVAADGDPEHTLRLALPPDIEPGTAIDVVVMPARVAAAPRALRAQSVRVLGIRPVG